MRVLGIETSCDETAAAIVQMTPEGSGKILSNIIYSQIKEHAAFGGVVPEIAARSHLSLLDGIIEQALDEANIDLANLDAIAVTSGPGLVGGLLTGLMTAKALALATGKPLLAINHLEGHALTPRLTNGIAFPYLLLLVSGGHTQFIEVRNIGEYHRLATTIDDALGEAFDKTAKLLGLGYPGGPKVEQAALKGNGARFDFPRPLQKKSDLNFSFSGLKTAVRQEAEKLAPRTIEDINDICASFQAAVSDVLSDRTRKMIQHFELNNGPASTEQPYALVIAGGVAANQQIRKVLQVVCQSRGWRIIAPPLNLCTDNAAMIAWAGLERLDKFLPSPMNTAPRSRWPLDEVSQSMMGGGRRGPKV